MPIVNVTYPLPPGKMDQAQDFNLRGRAALYCGRRSTAEEAELIPQEDYRFPYHKLKRTLVDESKTPLVLVACGSFSPMASDFVRFNTDFEVSGGYLSPVSDGYKKVGLAAGYHRVNMCVAAIEQSSWLMVDPFETSVRNSKGEPQYVPTACVLAHIDHEINDVLGGVSGKRARICLLAGSDLIQTMSTPNLWSSADLDIILSHYGCFIIERSGTDIEEALAALRQYEDNIWLISQVVQNNISSTKVRLFLKKGLSVRYLIPDPVVAYIEEHGLFQEGSQENSKGETAAGDSRNSSNAQPSKPR
ncbi:putative nicotinamide mononucleotide adenylyltransferase [Phialemonium atrogriseum]|uniref:Nicotinamide mononucleotide adenylyltransferase n=1 Tax=Phialemonium atrogriseum TaxID=1093897 RepID=A0AAJ0FS58_9PEZI|nr:putative nicotinamide mononucleotide adenylyltransferase [Phialemonium atrogriseum]KAK1772933.1 putative nicotinamide mononucleotide adenylyltransferase [Phialemonium atrogriseum]